MGNAKPQYYLRENARPGSISRRLAARGNVNFSVNGTEPGYEINEVSKDPMVAMIEILGLERCLADKGGTLRNGLISRTRMANCRAEMLRKLWGDALDTGYFVAWSWTENGSIDTSRMLVSGWPIEVDYANTLRPEPVDPITNAVASAELSEGREPQAQADPMDQWFAAVAQDAAREIAPPLKGEWIRDRHTGGYVWVPQVQQEGVEAVVEAVQAQEVQKVEEDPEEAVEAVLDPMAHYRALRESVEVQEEVQEEDSPADEWDLMGNLFITPQEVAAAVADIIRHHDAAMDVEASAMERRLHAHILHATAAGSPHAAVMADLAMGTHNLFFHRA